MPQLRIIATLALSIVALLFASCKQKEAVTTVKEAQTRAHISALADSIASDDVITTRSIARMPGDAPQYSRREALMAEASKAELLGLTGHAHPVVRLTAFEGLYRNRAEGLDGLFAKIINDPSHIHYLRGDISIMMPMLEYVHVNILALPMPGEGAAEVFDLGPSDYTPSPELVSLSAQKVLEYRKQGEER